MSDKQTKELVATNANVANISIDNLNILDPAQYDILKATMINLSKSKKSGISSVEDGIAIFARARELNLPFLSSMEHIHVINGKTGLDVHLIKALLLKAGVIFNKIKDYAPQYEYTDGNNLYVQLPDFATIVASPKEAKEMRAKDSDAYPVWVCRCYSTFNNQLLKEVQLTDKHKIVYSREEGAKVHNEGNIPIYIVPAKPIDYVTEYEFSRTVKGNVMKAIGRFSYSEAMSAELFNNNTYQKYGKVMISHRAFTYGAREIANDLLMGCMETTELRVVNNQSISDSDFVDVEIC